MNERLKTVVWREAPSSEVFEHITRDLVSKKVHLPKRKRAFGRWYVRNPSYKERRGKCNNENSTRLTRLLFHLSRSAQLDLATRKVPREEGEGRNHLVRSDSESASSDPCPNKANEYLNGLTLSKYRETPVPFRDRSCSMFHSASLLRSVP